MLHIKLQWLSQGSESHTGRQEMVGIGGARDSAVLKQGACCLRCQVGPAKL